MIKAIAIKQAGGKVEILHAGEKGNCMKIAHAEAQKIEKIGDAEIQVFSGSEWSDNGRKADFARRQAADIAKAEAEAKKRAQEAKAKRVKDLEAQLAEAKGEEESKPTAKKAAKKAD